MNNQPDTSLGCMPSGNSTNLDLLIDQLQAELANEHGTLLRDIPVEDYVARLYAYPEIAGLGYRSAFISDLCRQIRERAGGAALPRYHKLVLATLIQNAPEQLRQIGFPEEIEQLFQQNFHRIANALASGTEPLDFYGYTNSHFRKDIALCALRLIPVGARKIHVHGMARRPILLAALRGSARAAFRLWRSAGGFKPLYEWHTDIHDPDAMAEFNPEGWERCFRRIAQLLQSRPHIRGAFGSSWLYDPQLAQVSPRHSYMREFVLNHGGRLLCLGPCKGQGLRDALAKSPTRQRLYEQGKYHPMTCLLAWSRSAMIHWAGNNG